MADPSASFTEEEMEEMDALGSPRDVFGHAEMGNQLAKRYVEAMYSIQSKADLALHCAYLEELADHGMFFPLLFITTGTINFGDDTVDNAIKLAHWMERLFVEFGDRVWDKEDVEQQTRAHIALRLGASLVRPAISPVAQVPMRMRDDEKGVHYLEMAHSLGRKPASRFLMLFHAYDDVDKAIEWAHVGAKLGNGQCAIYLANMAHQDIRMQRKWLKAAARMGSQEADEGLSDESIALMKTKAVLEMNQKLNGSHLPPECSFCVSPEPPGQPFLFCGRCRLAKYCSKECQTEHFRNGHKADCKANVAQKKDFHDNYLQSLLGCDAPGCTRLQQEDGSACKQCSGCKYMKYCSKECQKAHWKAGHKHECEGICQIAALGK